MTSLFGCQTTKASKSIFLGARCSIFRLIFFIRNGMKAADVPSESSTTPDSKHFPGVVNLLVRVPLKRVIGLEKTVRRFHRSKLQIENDPREVVRRHHINRNGIPKFNQDNIQHKAEVWLNKVDKLKSLNRWDVSIHAH